jgi:hypothetical protein
MRCLGNFHRCVQIHSRGQKLVTRGGSANGPKSGEFPDKLADAREFLRAGDLQRNQRLVWRDCVRHQVVGANRRDFLVRRIARHFRELRQLQSVCWVFSAVSATHCRRERSKSLAADFRFQGCCLLPCPPRPASNDNSGFEPRYLTTPRGKTNERGRIVPYAFAGAWSPSVRH